MPSSHAAANSDRSRSAASPSYDARVGLLDWRLCVCGSSRNFIWSSSRSAGRSAVYHTRHLCLDQVVCAKVWIVDRFEVQWTVSRKVFDGNDVHGVAVEHIGVACHLCRRRSARVVALGEHLLEVGLHTGDGQAALDRPLRRHLREQRGLHERRCRAVLAGRDSGDTDMLQIPLRQLIHANRVAAHRLIGVLHRAGLVRGPVRKLIARVPAREARTRGWSGKRHHLAVSPIDEDVVELDRGNVSPKH
jgi:hypothetical protein